MPVPITLSDDELREVFSNIKSYDDRVKDFAEGYMDWVGYLKTCRQVIPEQNVLASIFAVGFELGRVVAEVEELKSMYGNSED